MDHPLHAFHLKTTSFGQAILLDGKTDGKYASTLQQV
jgi:hypothetical protein